MLVSGSLLHACLQWKGHREQINHRREELKQALKSWEKSNCGPPPPRAKDALEKSKDGELRDEWNRRQNPSQRDGMPDWLSPFPSRFLPGPRFFGLIRLRLFCSRT